MLLPVVEYLGVGCVHANRVVQAVEALLKTAINSTQAGSVCMKGGLNCRIHSYRMVFTLLWKRLQEQRSWGRALRTNAQHMASGQ